MDSGVASIQTKPVAFPRVCTEKFLWVKRQDLNNQNGDATRTNNNISLGKKVNLNQTMTCTQKHWEFTWNLHPQETPNSEIEKQCRTYKQQ